MKDSKKQYSLDNVSYNYLFLSENNKIFHVTSISVGFMSKKNEQKKEDNNAILIFLNVHFILFQQI